MLDQTTSLFTSIHPPNHQTFILTEARNMIKEISETAATAAAIKKGPGV